MIEWFYEIDYSTIVIFASAVVALVLQLLLCFKAKRTLVRLLPIILLMISTIAFSICSAVINGRDGLDYLFFALLSFGLIFACAVGWGIWAVVRKKK